MSIQVILRTAFNLLAGRSYGTNGARAAYARDPLAHPAIAAMSPREIADLPAGELRACGR